MPTCILELCKQRYSNFRREVKMSIHFLLGKCTFQALFMYVKYMMSKNFLLKDTWRISIVSLLLWSSRVSRLGRLVRAVLKHLQAPMYNCKNCEWQRSSSLEKDFNQRGRKMQRSMVKSINKQTGQLTNNLPLPHTIYCSSFPFMVSY